MKIDFICPVKIDDEKRMALLQQSLSTLHTNTPKEFINRVLLIDDMSSMFIGPKTFSCPEGNYIVSRNIKQLGVGGSKNKGIEIHKLEGCGDMLYIFDGDVYFTPFWLQYLLEAYELNKDKFKIIGGGIHPYLQPRAGEDTSRLTSHDALSGWSWLLSYDTWNKYGKMADNALGVGKSEDWEWSQRVRNDGYLVGCLKEQVIAHCGITNSEGNQIPGYDESIQLAKKVAPDAILL